jgi:ABC-2 type transport system permease protein
MAAPAFLLVTGRVLRELRRDYRTLFLFIVSPAFVLILAKGMLQDYPDVFARIGLITLGLFPTAPAFVFTAFAMHRERHRGTLEHLLTEPVRKSDVALGYVLAFSVLAVVQVSLSLGLTYGPLGLHSAGAWWVVGLLALLNCVLGIGLGFVITNAVHDEFQLAKVLPTTAGPQLMLSGLFLAHDKMPGWMKVVSDFAPWRYSVAAVSEFQTHVAATATAWSNLGVVVGIVALLFSLSALTVLRRAKP